MDGLHTSFATSTDHEHGHWSRTIHPASCSKTVHRHQLWLIHRPRTSTWPLVVTWALDVDTDPDCSRIMDPDVVLGDSTDPVITMVSLVAQITHNNMTHGYHHCFRLHPRLRTPSWPSVATQVPDINRDPGGNSSFPILWECLSLSPSPYLSLFLSLLFSRHDFSM